MEVLNMRILVSFLLLFITPSLLFTQGYTYWQENGVPVHEGTGALKPAIVNDENGNAIVFWADTRFTSIYLSICAQKIDSFGNLLWEPEVMVMESVGPMTFGEIVAVGDGEGGAIAVWPHSYDEYDIYAARVDSSGNVLWITHASGSMTGDFYPVATPDGYGGVVIAWVQMMPNGWDVFVQRVDHYGTPLWGNGINVSNSEEASSNHPSITSFQDEYGDYYYIVIWTDHRQGYYDLYAQLLSTDGEILWDTGGKVICDEEGQQGGLVTALKNKALIVWNDTRSGDVDIYMQLVDKSGNFMWDSCGIPLMIAPGHQWSVALINNDGNVFLVCLVIENGYYTLYAQAVDTTGVGLWGPQGVYVGIQADTSQSMVGVSLPVMVPDYQGGVIVAWQGLIEDTWDIYAQHIDSSGQAVWQENGLPVCTAQGTQQMPDITTDNQNGAIIVWTDLRGAPHNGAYAQRVNDRPPQVVENNFTNLISTPFNVYPSGNDVKIIFYLSKPSFTQIKIYDVSGRLLNKLLSQKLNEGKHTLIWNKKDKNNQNLSSGIYFIRMETETFRKTQKVVILR
jgi:hypothetical protein